MFKTECVISATCSLHFENFLWVTSMTWSDPKWSWFDLLMHCCFVGCAFSMHCHYPIHSFVAFSIASLVYLESICLLDAWLNNCINYLFPFLVNWSSTSYPGSSFVLVHSFKQERTHPFPVWSCYFDAPVWCMYFQNEHSQMHMTCIHLQVPGICCYVNVA